MGDQKVHGAIFSWSSLLLFNLFLLAIMILATRLATFLHELIGHALLALTFGGNVSGIRVSLFGGGRVFYQLEAGSGLLVRPLVAFGGIFINILTGILPFLYIRKLGKRPAWALFLSLFGMVSLLGALAYTSLGFYYDQGDPAAWHKDPSPVGTWFSIPFLVFSPFVSYFVIKSYSILTESWFPARTFQGRIGILILTLGLTGCAYAGLFGLTGQRVMALDTPSLAYQRAEKEVREIKKEELYRSLRKSRPELPEEDARELVEKMPIIVEPDDVPKKFPLIPIIVVLYAAGALFALQNTKGGMVDSYERIAPRSGIFAVALAGAILGVLAWTGGWIWSVNGL